MGHYLDTVEFVARKTGALTDHFICRAQRPILFEPEHLLPHEQRLVLALGNQHNAISALANRWLVQYD